MLHQLTAGWRPRSSEPDIQAISGDLEVVQTFHRVAVETKQTTSRQAHQTSPECLVAAEAGKRVSRTITIHWKEEEAGHRIDCFETDRVTLTHGTPGSQLSLVDRFFAQIMIYIVCFSHSIPMSGNDE